MALRLSLFLLAVALVACNRSNQRRPGDEYLKAIKVEGNKDVKQGKLLGGLGLKRSLKRGRPPDPYMVQVDEDRIRGEYLRRGYLAIDVRSRVERKGDAATVVYTVEEGPRAATRVVINGIPEDPDLTPGKIRAVLPLRDGAPFYYETYELAKPMLLGIAKDAGYAHAKLDATVYADRANQLAIVQLDYDLGPKSTFGTVAITGVDGRLAEAVRERMAFATGEKYSTSAITQSQRQLYGLSRFSTVQVQPEEAGDNPVVNVKVAVSEAARREIKLGGGFGLDPTAYEVRGRAGYSITGWPFPMDTVSLDLRPAYAYLRDDSGWQPRIRANLKLSRQDLFWTYARGEAEVGYNYLAVEAYTSKGPRARLGFTTPLIQPLGTSRLQLNVAWGIEQLDFPVVSPLIDDALEAQLKLDGTQRVGTYSQSLTADLRDNPVQPRLGVYGEIRVVEGTKFAGSSYEYLEVIPELRGYVPIGDVVVAARVRTATFYGDVPVTERFFSGGASNHRGFGERRLAPSVTGIIDEKERTVPYGGAGLLETGLEARIPLTTWRKIGIGTVVFLDGGDVREELSDIDLGALHWAAGLGLRLNTIVGPIRADLGYRLNRTGPMEPAPGSRFAFHLSLGEAF